MVRETEENLRRLYELGNVKKEFLYKMALDGGYKGPKSDNEQIREFLLSINSEEFERIGRNYIDANRSTNFIFMMEEVLSTKIKRRFNDILGAMPTSPSDDFSNYFLTGHYFNRIENEQNLRISKVERDIIYSTWNSELDRIEHKASHEVKKCIIKILYDKNILIVRSHSLRVAKDIIRSIFPDYHNEIKLKIFSENDKINIIASLVILRGANVRFEGDEEVQSAIFTAGQSDRNAVLKNLKDSLRFQNAKEGGEIRVCRFSHPRDPEADVVNLTSKDVVTFGINFTQGKVYFSNFLDESETKEWILNILSYINLD